MSHKKAKNKTKAKIKTKGITKINKQMIVLKCKTTSNLKITQMQEHKHGQPCFCLYSYYSSPN